MSWQTVDGSHKGYVSIEVPDGRRVTAVEDDRLVLDDASSVSISETIGWLARCTCDWKAPLMIRRLTDRSVSPGPDQVYDPEGGPAPKWVEDNFYTEWLDHVRPTSLDLVRRAAHEAEAADRRLDDAVAATRNCGVSWSDIGEAVGISRQSAHTRWRRFDTADRGE